MKHGESIAGVKVKCTTCNESFLRTPNESDGNVFCSEKCFGEWKSEQQRGKDNQVWVERVDLVCDYCDSEYTRMPHEIKDNQEHTFCSRGCYQKWMSENNIGENNHNWSGGKQEYECDWCENVFKRLPCFAKGEHQFCSYDCYFNWESTIVGPEHPNWIEDKNHDYGPYWTTIRRDILSRDDYECQSCGLLNKDSLKQHERELEVHHITPRRKFDDITKANESENLITLCTSCHTSHEAQRSSREEIIA